MTARFWTINGRFLTQSLTGVQRYAREIVRALDALVVEGHLLASDLEIELVVPARTADDLGLKAIRTRVASGATGHAWEQFVLPRESRGGLLSLCNTGPLAAARHIVCIHDLNTRVVPQSYSRSFRAFYRIMLPLLGRRAQRIATVSNYSATQLVNYDVCRLNQIFVAPNGADHTTRWKPRHSAATQRVANGNTVAVIGSTAPHKNIGLIMDIVEGLACIGLQVAVLGGLDTRVFGAGSSRSASAANAAIISLGRLSDNEVAAVLRDSMCLAFPSFAEGFGLPPLEAMAMGCPVVVSDRTSIPEICGDAALYASPSDPEAWLEAFTRLRSSPALRNQMIARGLERARLYRWKISAERYLQQMALVDGL